MTTIPFIAPATLGAAIALACLFVAPGTAHAQVGGVVIYPQKSPRYQSSGEIGFFFGAVPGVLGDYANPSLQITPGVSVAAGDTVRYHITVAYSQLSAIRGTYHAVRGIDLRPLTLGFPVHVATGDGVSFAIEPLLELVGMQAYFGNRGAAYLFSSGVGLQGVFNFKSAYISVAPLNLQLQYAAVGKGQGGSQGGTGFGLNTPLRLSFGVRF